ncbi:mobilization protein BmgA [Crocosphaera watsonii WH 0402]|uniref:Mobilization protein BmgA n=1 Tax=Crocosphaera watsonii WH 0402 TaxID=1284629 RepID=T2K074_CROWT|nr:relaxase/mobilization nuclease domain-containing protein [Crocosphaera watsonii]CCQ70995.1 mobilization protein BmgA [Crocosphaera watsonii WH 0402]
MIVKQIKGKGFYGCLKYVMEKAKATFIEGNVYAFDGIREMAKDFRYYCSINHRVQRVVYHATLSVPEEDKDKLNDDQWGDVGRRFLEKMNFCSDFEDMDVAQVPYIIVRHHDKDHDHIHIVAGRVRSDGTCVSDSWDYRRGEKAVRELEVEFGLSQPFKQTNRKSPHPYLVEKLERIYQNSDDNVVSTPQEEETPSLPENDPIADQVNQILEYRKQLLDSKKSEDEEKTSINEEGEANDYSLSSLIERANKANLSPNSREIPPSNNTPISTINQNTQSPSSPVTTPPNLELTTLINEVCQQVKTIPEFLKTLSDRGVEATVKLTRNQCVQGIVYYYQGQRISGTQLGAAYTFPGLRKRQKLRFEKHHLPEIEAHNNSCQPLPAPPKWQWLQFVANRFNQWLNQNQKQRYQDDNFEVRRDRDWLIIASHDSSFFVKARYDFQKRQWLPQSGWRFNQQAADFIRRKLSALSRENSDNIRRNFRSR